MNNQDSIAIDKSGKVILRHYFIMNNNVYRNMGSFRKVNYDVSFDTSIYFCNFRGSEVRTSLACGKISVRRVAVTMGKRTVILWPQILNLRRNLMRLL